ncbi:MAG: hypothetical protein ACRDF4_00555 [Rhabdochlamydiaceae bacterium]
MKYLTLEQLRELCLQYDQQHDVWPESKFEGLSVYGFVAAKLGSKKEEDEDKWDTEILERKVEQVIDEGHL